MEDLQTAVVLWPKLQTLVLDHSVDLGIFTTPSAGNEITMLFIHKFPYIGPGGSIVHLADVVKHMPCLKTLTILSLCHEPTATVPDWKARLKISDMFLQKLEEL